MTEAVAENSKSNKTFIRAAAVAVEIKADAGALYLIPFYLSSLRARTLYTRFPRCRFN